MDARIIILSLILGYYMISPFSNYFLSRYQNPMKHGNDFISLIRKYEHLFPQRNRNFKAFHHRKIEENRQNRKIDLKAPSSHFCSFL